MNSVKLGFVGILGIIVGWLGWPLLPDSRPPNLNHSSGARESILGERTSSPMSTTPHWYRSQSDPATAEYQRLRMMAVNASPTSAEGLNQCLLDAIRVRHSRQRSILLQEVLRQWMMVDPVDALEHCQKLVESDHRHEALYAWGQQLGSADPEKAIMILLEELPPGNRHAANALRGLTEAIGRHSPDDVFQLMETYEVYPGEGLAVVAQLRPRDTMAFVLNKVDPGGFDGAVQLVIQQWSEESPDEVMSFYEDLSEADRERVRLPLVKGVASADAKLGAELAVALEPENAFLLAEIMNDWKNMTEAAAWASSLESETVRRRVYERILPSLSRQDPQAALPLLEEYDSLRDNCASVFRNWAKTDFDAAYQAIDELEDPLLKAKAIEGMLPQIARDHPGSLRVQLDYLLELGGGVLRVDVSGLLQEMDSDECAELVSAYPEALSRSVGRLVESVGWSDPERALKIAEALPDSEAKADGIQRPIITWAQTEPEVAAAWVADMPPGEGRDYAAMNLINTWSRYDPRAAAEWVRTLEDTQQRELAVEEFIRSNAFRDGPAAWSMAKALENSEQRLAMQALALTAWADGDPEGAAAALKETPSVPAELQAAYDKAVETSRAWQEFLTP